jgi:diaminopimelate epimerase
VSAGGIRVAKMSGAGNDFLVLDGDQAAEIPGGVAAWARLVCRRRLSVGADGVLVVRPQDRGRVGVDFYNPDGSAAFCGNGSRCAARFAHHRGYTGPSLVLETVAGPVPARVEGEHVRLELPPPTHVETCRLAVGPDAVAGSWIRAGSPHFVVFVDDPLRAPLERWGPALRRHERFGEAGVNVDVASRSGSPVHVRTWERGVEGETLACGSGAVAAAFAARRDGAGDRIAVLPASGIPLDVEFAGPQDAPSSTALTGDARILFEGRIGPEAVRGF